MAEVDKKLAAVLERTGASGSVAGLQLNRQSFLDALRTDPEKLNDVAFRLGRLAGKLPWGTINPLYQPIYRLKRDVADESLVRNTADGLQRCRNVADETKVDPGRLADLVDVDLTYRGIEQIGARAKDRGMDLRTVLGAWQWFLIGLVMKELERRFANPALTQKDQEKLLDAFGGGLLLLDELFQWAVQRKQELAQLKDTLNAQVQDAQDEAAMVETILQLKQGITPGQDALIQAAKRHLKKQGGQGTAGAAPQAPQAPPPVKRPRRLV